MTIQAGKPRSARLDLRLPVDDKAALVEAAAAEGITVSELIRRKVLGAHVPSLGGADRSALGAVSGQLRRLGNNFNQWLRAAHLASRGLGPAETLRLRVEALVSEAEAVVPEACRLLRRTVAPRPRGIPGPRERRSGRGRGDGV